MSRLGAREQRIKETGNVLRGLWELTWLQTILCWFLTLCGVLGAANSWEGGCVFSGLQLYIWMDAWIFPEDRQILSNSTSMCTCHLAALGGVFSDVLEMRSPCAEQDTVMLGGSIIYSWGYSRVFFLGWWHMATKYEHSITLWDLCS